MELSHSTTAQPLPNSSTPAAQADHLMQVAQALEASFLAEMLKSAGIGKTPEGFGGGVGEDQFGSFMREQQAMQMTKAGGIGLAQALFDSMTAQQNG